MTVLLLAFFSLMGVLFSTMLSLHLGQSRNYLSDTLLENGEQAVLNHALVLCDHHVSNAGLLNRTFSSGWEVGGEKELRYSFKITDQMRNDLFPSPPVTALRERNGKERYNLAVLDSEDQDSAFLKESCAKILAEEKRPADEVAGIVDRMLDELDVNRASRENDRDGESLFLTGLTKGDNRIFTPVDIMTLSSFFDLNREKLEPYEYFLVRDTHYEVLDSKTNLFVSMREQPWNEKRIGEWNHFRSQAGNRLGSLWEDWEWVGKEVRFLSACGGKYIKAKILEARKEGFLLEGTPEVTIDSTLTRDWCNSRSEPGSLKLQPKSNDLWVIMGLQTNVYYDYKLRQVEGRTARPFFIPDAITQTGNYFKVLTDKNGNLVFTMPKSTRSSLYMGIELRTPDIYHFENVSSATLDLRDWKILTETPEGLTFEVSPEWVKHPVLKPGDKMDILSWHAGESGKTRVSGFAPQAAWAVPAKIKSKRFMTSSLGYYASIILETNNDYERREHIRHSFVYIGSAKRKKLMPFPISKQEGGSLVVFLGPKQYARDWYRQLDDKIYFGDFQVEMMRDKSFLCDQWGQKTTRLNQPSTTPWMIGYRDIKNPETNKKDLENCLKKFVSRKAILPFSGKPGHLTETTALAIPSGGNKLLLHDKPAFKENFWKGCDCLTEDGEVYRIVSSKGAAITLDRNHKLKKEANILITPDGVDRFLAGPILPERVWTLKLTEDALLPGDLYLPGHAPFPDQTKPEYKISVYNALADKWEVRAYNAVFPEGDVLHLGRITKEHRLAKGEIKIKVSGKGAGPSGYWLRQPFLISDNMLRKDKSERCDSFVVTYEISALDKKEKDAEPIVRKGAFLIQRQWERGKTRPRSYFAGKTRL